MTKYDPKKIEPKWQKYWEKNQTFAATEDPHKEKFYALVEFPYPSGAGLHVGHPRPFTAMDVIARKKRMEGKNVLYPMGFDAFGLPTENYAIKTGRAPADVTRENIANFTRQLKSLGFSFDWSRCIDTTDPKYYKWTQWLFLQFFKHGLAYKKNQPINWCPKDKIGLANEEVVNGCCERCGEAVERRNKEQWMLGITKYADKLLEGLKEVDYIPQARTQQENWIGKSEGAEIEFRIKNQESRITVFTTRPETLFGAFAIIIAPEHALIKSNESVIENLAEVQQYIEQVKKKSDIERTELQKEKTGVEVKGLKVINPLNGEELPIWIADFVLGNYGTGSVFADMHDERDFAFAKKYNLPLKQVVMPNLFDEKNPPQKDKVYTKRETVHVILRNTKNKTVLVEFLKGDQWKGNEPRNFIIGGIEEGEKEVETAIREIREETGYVNVSFVEKVPLDTQANFFAAHKGVNRNIHVSTLVFDLIDEKKVEITEDEYFNKDSHEIKWIPYEKVAETLTIPDDKMAWKYYSTGGFAYTGDGILINSDFLNGLTTEEGKEKIIEFLEKNNCGKRKVQYKLRDWVFSRQRYWGEPIPLVYCETCAKRKEKVVIVHCFEGSAQDNWYLWLKTELEKKGFEVFVPNLPNSKSPALQEWVGELKKLPLSSSDNITIIGHSLGAPAACKFVAKTNLLIQKLILVAPVYKSNFDYLETHGFTKDDRKILEHFGKEGVQALPSIQDRVTETLVVLSKDDPFIPLEAAESYAELKPRMKIFENKSHFSKNHGNATTFPEILEEFEMGRMVNPGWVPVLENQLPLTLPKVEKYEPTDTGESPLSTMTDWVNTDCPRCAKMANETKYLIFDFDGVIGDTLEASVKARVAMGVVENAEAALEQLKSYCDKKPNHTKNHSLTPQELSDQLDWTKRHGECILEAGFDLFEEFVAEIKKIPNRKIAVVSSGSRLYVEQGAKRSGLEASHILTYEDHHSKEEKIERICKAWGVELNEVYYFTDTKADVYELENFLDRQKLVGCSWGHQGYEKLAEVLPENQILKNFNDIHNLFKPGQARRETDTMPNWAGSSWYWLRYMDPHNDSAFAAKEKLQYWNQVDWYNGGMEHTVLHLLYSRFWNQFFFDIGLVPTLEPYKKRTSHGMILAKGGEKMSKSRGNVVNPDDMVEQFGADALRAYIMFMGPFDQAVEWDTNGLVGVRRFLDRVWNLQEKIVDKKSNENITTLLHQTIKKVGEDIEAMRFNTAISALMELTNEMTKEENISKDDYAVLTKLLSPFAPHMSEEIWKEVLENTQSIAFSDWPKYDPNLIQNKTFQLVVQLNGKMRDSIELSADISEDEAKTQALKSEKVQKWLEGKEPKKIIYVKGKLVSIVV